MQLTMHNLEREHCADAFVVNSGCANACVGAAGDQAALAVTEYAAKLLGSSPSRIVYNSTGVIGYAVDSEKMMKGLGYCLCCAV